MEDALLKISGGKITVEVAESLAVLGNVYEKQGMYTESMECLEKALGVQLKELGEEHATVADTYAKLGWTCSRDGKYDKAMEYHQKGLSIRLKVHGEEDHVDVGDSHNALGGIYDDQGKYEEALKHYEIALRIKIEARYNMVPSLKHWQCTRKSLLVRPRVATYNNMAIVYMKQGKYDEALAMYEDSVDLI